MAAAFSAASRLTDEECVLFVQPRCSQNRLGRVAEPSEQQWAEKSAWHNTWEFQMVELSDGHSDEARVSQRRAEIRLGS